MQFRTLPLDAQTLNKVYQEPLFGLLLIADTFENRVHNVIFRKCLKIRFQPLTQPSPRGRGLQKTASFLAPSPSGRRLG
jgi:hypothetical protein